MPVSRLRYFTLSRSEENEEGGGGGGEGHDLTFPVHIWKLKRFSA